MRNGEEMGAQDNKSITLNWCFPGETRHCLRLIPVLLNITRCWQVAHNCGPAKSPVRLPACTCAAVVQMWSSSRESGRHCGSFLGQISLQSKTSVQHTINFKHLRSPTYF